jgi:hypothetical protein
MDARGTLWLDASEEDREAWADFLGGADLSFAAAKRTAAAALRRLEAGAAVAAGVGMVFAPAVLAAAPEYRWAAGGRRRQGRRLTAPCAYSLAGGCCAHMGQPGSLAAC